MNSSETKRPRGRPKVVVDDADTVAKELIFPALCMAFRSEEDDEHYGKHHLTVWISKVAIQRIYGKKGLKLWESYFTLVKRGGLDRMKRPYPSRWVLQFGQYAVAKQLVESLGHNMKDLPNPGFPPPEMKARLRELEERVERIRAKQVAELEVA